MNLISYINKLQLSRFKYLNKGKCSSIYHHKGTNCLYRIKRNYHSNTLLLEKAKKKKKKKSKLIEDDEIILKTKKKIKKKSTTLTDDELFEQIMNSGIVEEKKENVHKENLSNSDDLSSNNEKLENLINNSQFEEAEKLYQSLTKHVSLIASNKKYNNTTHRLAAYMYFITGQYDKAIKICHIIFTMNYEFTETLIMILTLLAEKRIEYNEKINELIDQWWKVNDERLKAGKYSMSAKLFDSIISKYYELGMTYEIYDLLDKLLQRNISLNINQVSFLLKSMLKQGFDDDLCKKVVDLLNRNPHVLNPCQDLIKEINKVNVKFQLSI